MISPAIPSRNPLTILIPTLRAREASFRRLVDSFPTGVPVLHLSDDGQETTGRKRQRLLESATTPYVAFVDDDDELTVDYFPCIMDALAQAPDVVGFILHQFDGGKFAAESIHSVTSLNWRTEKRDGKITHFRTPNHLNPVRREMALSVGYIDKTIGEDSDYSRRLFEKYPNMREIFIDRPLYRYMRRC